MTHCFKPGHQHTTDYFDDGDGQSGGFVDLGNMAAFVNGLTGFEELHAVASPLIGTLQQDVELQRFSVPGNAVARAQWFSNNANQGREYWFTQRTAAGPPTQHPLYLWGNVLNAGDPVLADVNRAAIVAMYTPGAPPNVPPPLQMDTWKGYRELYYVNGDEEVRVGTMLAWRNLEADVDTWAIWTVSKAYELLYDKQLLLRGVEGWPAEIDDALAPSALQDTAEWVATFANGAADATRYVGRYRVYGVTAAGQLPVDPPPAP